MLVVPKVTTTGEAMKLLRNECSFGVGQVRDVAGSDRWVS
jgi:hypothetical protein